MKPSADSSWSCSAVANTVCSQPVGSTSSALPRIELEVIWFSVVTMINTYPEIPCGSPPKDQIYVILWGSLGYAILVA